jgi:hexokinase
MGKGFAITSDLNLGKMLLAGYERHLGEHSQIDHQPYRKGRHGLPRIRIAAITNDTVATFASLSYSVKAVPNSRVAMGLIVGTGTNATVPMKLEALHPAKRHELANPNSVETVVVNTEWTINGTEKPLLDLNIKTKWDLALDANSEAPGFQPLEYMTSGRYLGEIVRLVFCDLIGKENDTHLPRSLRTKNALPTKFLSEVVAKADDEALQVAFEETYASVSPSETFWTPQRINWIRAIAQAVQQRSSALIAAACVGLLDCIQDLRLDRSGVLATNGEKDKRDENVEELVIAYTGGTISQYPKWLESCQQWIDILVEMGSPSNASKRVVLREALDGGIIGAGVLAGMTDSIA